MLKSNTYLLSDCLVGWLSWIISRSSSTGLYCWGWGNRLDLCLFIRFFINFPTFVIIAVFSSSFSSTFSLRCITLIFFSIPTAILSYCVITSYLFHRFLGLKFFTSLNGYDTVLFAINLRDKLSKCTVKAIPCIFSLLSKSRTSRFRAKSLLTMAKVS